MRTIRIVAVLSVIVAAVVAQPFAASAAAGGEPGPNVIPLGFAIHKGRLVEGYAFVHTRDDVKPVKRGSAVLGYAHGVPHTPGGVVAAVRGYENVLNHNYRPHKAK